MFPQKIKLPYYALWVSLINVILYNRPMFSYVYDHIDHNTFNGVLLIVSLVVLSIVLNGFVFYLGLYLLRGIGKWILVLFFGLNSLCVYFINTYGVVIDITMIGNVFNTNFEEAGSFFSFPLLFYFIFWGILPGLLIHRFQFSGVRLKTFLLHQFFLLIFLLSLAWANAANWLWIDKNSTRLGALVMPWSYVVNTSRFYYYQHQADQKEILLPNAQITDDHKSVVVLVIGESARSANFSLYGYPKNTNPQLSQVLGLQAYEAESAATYTTAGVKAILDHKETNKLYEILPNYLHRNGVEVLWRTTNWGEPNVHITHYQDREYLQERAEVDGTVYDDILLYGLNDWISQSQNNKIFIVLHTSTSHGPLYHQKYPPEFESFSPVCKSVELSQCTQEELINAYDNTIVYTDHLLAQLIESLQQLEEFNTTMFFVSDHGESLGENNLYMHGLPMSIAPEVQYQIPFLVWTSDPSALFKDQKTASQFHFFHSVLDFLGVDSPVYDPDQSILK